MNFVQLTLLQRGVLKRLRQLGERQYAEMLEGAWKQGKPLEWQKIDVGDELCDDVARANGQAQSP